VTYFDKSMTNKQGFIMKVFKHPIKNQAGFTLIELMVVIIILGVLAA